MQIGDIFEFRTGFREGKYIAEIRSAQPEMRGEDLRGVRLRLRLVGQDGMERERTEVLFFYNQNGTPARGARIFAAIVGITGVDRKFLTEDLTLEEFIKQVIMNKNLKLIRNLCIQLEEKSIGIEYERQKSDNRFRIKKVGKITSDEFSNIVPF